MKQTVHFITLGVTDLERARAFYVNHFGWKPMKQEDDLVFFRVNGMILSLFPYDELAADAGAKRAAHGFKGFTLSVNFGSEREVDRVFESLRNKGTSIVKEPEKVFWGGYRGYVMDPDDNLWELAYNPFLELSRDDTVVAHK